LEREFGGGDGAAAFWTGAVAASATFNADAMQHVSAFDEVVWPGWGELVPLVDRLGGFGPAHLVVVAQRAWSGMLGVATLDETRAPKDPPTDSLFARLPKDDGTVIGRWVNVEAPSSDVLAGIQREMQRAAGIESFEAENPDG
jgi:hypothetical protein